MSLATDLNAADRVTSQVQESLRDIVQEILARRQITRLVTADEDLREVGLNSLDMVNLMLAVEGAFDLKIPDADMTLQNFRSIAAIETLVTRFRNS